MRIYTLTTRLDTSAITNVTHLQIFIIHCLAIPWANQIATEVAFHTSTARRTATLVASATATVIVSLAHGFAPKSCAAEWSYILSQSSYGQYTNFGKPAANRIWSQS